MSKARSWATTPEYGIQQARQGIVAIHAMGVSVSRLYSFHMHITYLGLVSCFLHSELPRGSPQGVAGCNLIAVRWQVFFSFLSAFRNHQLVFEGCNHWQLWHSCLLILQEICHFFNPHYFNYDPQNHSSALWECNRNSRHHLRPAEVSLHLDEIPYARCSLRSTVFNEEHRSHPWGHIRIIWEVHLFFQGRRHFPLPFSVLRLV